MTSTATATAPTVDGPTVRIAGRRYPLMLPSLGDPRLHIAAVVVSLQVLGQTALGFDLSIAQILVALLTCATIEVGITFRARRVVVWPASALLTANGVALILRVPGTEHGDWWSLRGAHIFAAIAALSLLSKYALRWGDRPLFNPSNLGLVVGFLVLGPALADPQDLWWGPMSPALAAALAIIAIGGLTVTRRLGLMATALGFWFTFAAGTGLLAATGHCITARWHVGPVCDWSYWWVLVTSPEILVFMLFMITDPRTIPSGDRSRTWFGVAVGAVAVLAAAPQTTEYATKVGILAALVVVCALRPLFDGFAQRSRTPDRPAVSAVGRRAILPLVAAIAVSSGVVALNQLADEPPSDATATEVVPAARPDLPEGEGPTPDVTVDDQVLHLMPSMADESTDLVDDVHADLRIEQLALESGDAPLAASAVRGRRLEAAVEAIRDGREPTERDHRIESLDLVLVRDAGPQAPPRIAAQVTGSVERDGGRAAWATTYVLADQDGHWLVTDELTPTD